MARLKYGYTSSVLNFANAAGLIHIDLAYNEDSTHE